MGNKEFIAKAKEGIIDAYNRRNESRPRFIKEGDLYVVWLTKALQNNKALLATNIEGDGLYFEVTYNGDKQEMYLDVYKKKENILFR